MENVYKRKLSEVIALYKLEPDSKDLYLEGREDSNIFEYFFNENDVSEIAIYEINAIDFSEVADVDLSSNKEKVKYFSKIIYSEFGANLKNVTCVVDRDFDTIDDNFIKNSYLLYTDFANLEMYFFNHECLNKFLRLGLKNFPLSSKEIMASLETILIDIYAFRYARDEINKSYQLPALDKTFKVSNGKIQYDPNEFLNKFINKNACKNQQKEFQEKILLVKNKHLELKESRYFMHGKDFIELFFNLVRKIKNPYNFNLKTFTRSIIITIEIELLKTFKLFSELLLKYEKVSA